MFLEKKNKQNIVNKGLPAYIWCILCWTGYFEAPLIRAIFSSPCDVELTGLNFILS